MTASLVVLRSALFALYFLLLTVLTGLGAFWIRLARPRLALGYAQRWAGLTLVGLRVICGVRLEISGREHLARPGPMLIASQHQSAFDALVWMNLVPRPAYVMKRELTRIPLVGPMLLLAGMIPLERGGGATALRQLMRQTDRAVADGRQIVIFPEGTRVAAGQIVPLQPGVAALAGHARLPVLPVATDSASCWARGGFIKRPGTIHIHIAAPLPADLRRAPMLAAIRAAWDTAGARNAADKPVDNLVGSFSPPGDGRG